MRRHHAQNITLATVLALAGTASAMAASEAPAGKDAMPGRAEMQFGGPGLVTPSGMSLYMYASEDSKSDRFRWQCTNIAGRSAPTVQLAAAGGFGGAGGQGATGVEQLAAAGAAAGAGGNAPPAAAGAAGGQQLAAAGGAPGGARPAGAARGAPAAGGQPGGAAAGGRGGGGLVIDIDLVQACTAKFKPYIPTADARPVGDFTIIKRPDGMSQWAYKGFPLYTNSRDIRPGERNASTAAQQQRGGAGQLQNNNGPVGPDLGIQIPAFVTNVRLARIENSMVLNIAPANRPLYTPRAKRPLAKSDDLFQPFLAPTIVNVSGDWSLVDAGGGRKQYAYKGKPLYLPPVGVSDYEVSLGKDWDMVVVRKEMAPPAQITKHMTLLGEVFSTTAGLTLYNYSCNAGGQTCTEKGDPAVYMGIMCGDSKECARRWHPYLASASAKGQGEWSVVDITYPMFLDNRGRLFPDGAPKVKAWAYKGNPVYTYYEDTQPGDIWGNKTGSTAGSAFGALQIPGRSASFEP